jgi:two-component system cell cycle sensor histidine kinase/response regulator CckA
MPKARILIVEDERIVAEDIKRALETFGYVVPSIAGSGTEAIRKAREESFDLAIMDIMLSGTMDGIDAAKSIRERFNIPIVFLTAHVDENLLARATITEPFGYLLKPFEDRELCSTIEIALYKKKSEMALIESEEFNKSLLDNAPNPVFVINPDTSMRFVNPAFERLTGFSSQEMIGQKIPYSWWTQEQRERSHRDLMESLYAEIKDFEQYYQKKNGERFWVLTNSTPVFRNGELKFCLSNWIDITEKKKAEEEKQKLQAQLLQMKKMEAIGNLAGGIAHDFNNILTIILGNNELALDDLPKDSPIRENILESYEAGKRAKNLVRQILAFSRNEEQEPKPTKVCLIVSEALKLLRSSLPTTIKICEHIASDSMAAVDPTQIHQVIMNLCTNAYHAMRESGGVLEIEVKDVELDDLYVSHSLVEQPGPYLRISVSDTGCGMEREVMDRIFEPYFTTKEIGQGTGMGLSVVHGIVKSHKGAITIYSEPGMGSTFHVYLPRIESDDATTESEEEETLFPRGTERILFIDDEESIVDLGRQMLNRLGYKVTTRTDSLEALQVFREQPDQFDLVITDMTMPNMTGNRLARELMGICPDIPIILCTGFSELITEERAKEMGIREFVMKPLIMSEMARVVRRALDT